MRDRLIELLGDFPIFHSTMKKRWMPEAVERLADHLLSEGVIVPKVKIGQAVYQLAHGYVEEERVRGTHTTYLTNGYSFSEKDFGKTVFLTKEEAEKALKERSENGKAD